jgi:hypothetical protein
LDPNHKIQVKINFNIAPETVPAFLSLVHPRLEHQLSLARRVQLIDALTELKMQVGSNCIK